MIPKSKNACCQTLVWNFFVYPSRTVQGKIALKVASRLESPKHFEIEANKLQVNVTCQAKASLQYYNS